MTTFICIGGKAQAGKDTCGKLFEKELASRGRKPLVTHYADLLKYICKTFFGWNGEKDEAGRTLLQRVGTDCVRKQEPNYWVDFIVNLVHLFPNEWNYVIIPDTRFPNELSRVDKEFPMVYVRIERDGFDNGLTEAQKQHPSETALDDVRPDFVIKNTSLESLPDQISAICDRI